MRASLIQFAVYSAITIRLALAIPPLPAKRRYAHPPGYASRLDKLGIQDIKDDTNTDDGGDDYIYGNVGWFEQYIDHDHPERGTFPQRYVWLTDYWNGSGSPVVITSSGEDRLEYSAGYMDNSALTGKIAQEIGAATLAIEHRFFGKSSPFKEHSTKNLQYLTTDQAMADFIRFAREVELPFDKNQTGKGTSNAPAVPWIWSDGSYAGSLGVWMEKLHSGTFWATHASSATVENIDDYWQYYVPIQNGLPHNCSCDFSRIIEHVDDVMLHGTPQQQTHIKAMFGFQDVQRPVDFTSALSDPLVEWDGKDSQDGYYLIYQMCDAIEGFGQNTSIKSTTYPPNDGVGLERALPNYAAWFTAAWLPGRCDNTDDPYDASCYNFNASSPDFTYQSANYTYRAWFWLVCNEPLAGWQTGAPRDRPTLRSRLVTAEYYLEACDAYFPREGQYTYGAAAGRTTAKLNAKTEGWGFTEGRIYHVNGQFDQFRGQTVASDFRPGGPFLGTKDTPSIIVKGGGHTCEMFLSDGDNPEIAAAQNAVLAQFSQWTKDFYDGREAST